MEKKLQVQESMLSGQKEVEDMMEEIEEVVTVEVAVAVPIEDH